MALNDSIASLNLNDLVEFDRDKRVVRKKVFQSDIIVTEIVCYEPGQFTQTHVHPNQDEIFYCLDGRGIITFADDEDVAIEPGSVVFVPKGTQHGVQTVDDERLVIVFTKGPGLPNPRRARKSA